MEVRSLTDDERAAYMAAVITAVDILPAFRDGLGLMRPYYNDSTPFAAIDEHSRVGLGPLFFRANPKQRASVLLHETMHVFSNHFSRESSTGIKDKQILNEAGDLEINYRLNKIPKVDISFGILPDDYQLPGGLTMEQYAYEIVKQRGDSEENQDSQISRAGEKGEKNESKGQQSEESYAKKDGGAQEKTESSEGEDSNAEKGENPGESKSAGEEDENKPSPGLSKEEFSELSNHDCGKGGEEASAAADRAGIERASDLEKSIAKKNTKARLEEEIRQARQAGKSHRGEFVDYVLGQLEPPKVKWEKIFSKIVGKTYSTIIPGKTDYSYRRPNRRMLSVSPYIFPGYVSYRPSAMVGVDTSGSMRDEDYLFTLSEVDTLVRKIFREGVVQLFTVDTKVSAISPVKDVKDLNLKGGGGTDMASAWRYILSLPKEKRPDVFILATDGGFNNWQEIEKLEKEAKLQGIKSIILITDVAGFASVPEKFKQSMSIIDISDSRKSHW